MIKLYRNPIINNFAESSAPMFNNPMSYIQEPRRQYNPAQQQSILDPNLWRDSSSNMFGGRHQRQEEPM